MTFEMKQRTMIIKMAMNCTPTEGSTKTAVEIYQAIDTKIKNFLNGEAEGSEQKQSFNFPGNAHLHLKITIPVPSLAHAATIETKLLNNIGIFPPFIDPPSYAIIGGVGEAVPPGE